MLRHFLTFSTLTKVICKTLQIEFVEGIVADNALSQRLYEQI